MEKDGLILKVKVTDEDKYMQSNDRLEESSNIGCSLHPNWTIDTVEQIG